MKCFLSIIYKYAHKRMIQTGLFFNGVKDRRMKLIQRVLPFFFYGLWPGGEQLAAAPIQRGTTRARHSAPRRGKKHIRPR